MKTKIKQIQKCCLKLFDEFIRIATKYNLSWFVDGGTLLGAVRNQQMIKWDDDIDIVMPRNDFNKLLKIGPLEFKNKYFFQTTDTDNIFQLCAKLRLNNTIGMTKNEYELDCHKGIFIDIFPLDYISNYDNFESEKAMIRQTKNIELSKELTMDKKRLAYRNINYVLTNYSNSDTKEYVAEMILYRYSKYKDMELRIASTAYSEYILINFKGLKQQIRIPIGYDEILRRWYGDNYLIPKKEKSLHGNTFYDVHHDICHYKNYKKVSFEQFCKSNNCTNC